MRLTMIRAVLYAALIACLVSCRSTPRTEPRPAPAAAVSVQSTIPAPEPSGHCGLGAYPASRPARDIVAAAPRARARGSNVMRAEIAIDPEGNISHVRITQLAYPRLENYAAINEQGLEKVKSWHYAPTMFEGKPIEVCSLVDVTFHLD